MDFYQVRTVIPESSELTQKSMGPVTPLAVELGLFPFELLVPPLGKAKDVLQTCAEGHFRTASASPVIGPGIFV